MRSKFQLKKATVAMAIGILLSMLSGAPAIAADTPTFTPNIQHGYQILLSNEVWVYAKVSRAGQDPAATAFFQLIDGSTKVTSGYCSYFLDTTYFDSATESWNAPFKCFIDVPAEKILANPILVFNFQFNGVGYPGPILKIDPTKLNAINAPKSSPTPTPEPVKSPVSIPAPSPTPSPMDSQAPAPALPVSKLKPSLQIPVAAKLGVPFISVVGLSGKGTASCFIYVSPTTNGGSAYSSQGWTSARFNVVGGKTAKIKSLMTLDAKGIYGVMLYCRDKLTGDDLPLVLKKMVQN